MRAIEAYFEDYGAYHRTRGNKLCHAVGIPLIAMTSLGLLDRVALIPSELPVHASVALLLWIGANAFYLALHFFLGATMVVSTFLLYLAGAVLPLWALWGLFVVGWALQAVGHAVYERRSPAFIRNFIHLLIGPLFIQNQWLRIVRIE